MTMGPRLTAQTVAVVRALLTEPTKARWGRDIAAGAGLKSGSLHPILTVLASLLAVRTPAPSAHQARCPARCIIIRRVLRIAYCVFCSLFTVH